MKEEEIDLMQEVIEKLQKIETLYEKDIPPEYIDRIREIWCDMQNEIEIQEDVEEEIGEPRYEYGYDYDRYIRGVR